MEHDGDLAKRTAAFQTLLRDVGEQLGRQNTDDIEFFESVPQDERGKGGIKLLEYLRNRGRFTQWRVQPLREILRRCNRCDLADNLVKKYQLDFSDRDSPQASRPLIDHVHVANKSPLLSSHRRTRSSPISWLADVQNPPTTLALPTTLPQQEIATASSHCIPGSLPNDCRGFTTSTSPTHLRQRSDEYQSPVQEGLQSASLSRLDYFGGSNSIQNPSIHMHPHQNCCSNNRYELANNAIRAMLEIVTHTNRTPSCTSIHSDNSFDYQATTFHTRTLSDEGKLTVKADSDENKTPVLVRRASDIHQSSPPSNRRSSSDCQKATGCVLGSGTPPLSPQTTTEGSDCASDQESLTKSSSQRTRLPRPVSGYRKLPLDNFRWLVKTERLLKSVLRPQEVKFQSIVCSRRLELEVGEGRYNPKLSLVLYPNGLFINKGKSASLQAKIVTPDKCPPLPPSLLVQLKVTVYGNDGQDMWKETSTQETINTYSFYIHNLFTCRTVREDCKGDHIHLSISVQIQKATEQ